MCSREARHSSPSVFTNTILAYIVQRCIVCRESSVGQRSHVAATALRAPLIVIYHPHTRATERAKQPSINQVKLLCILDVYTCELCGILARAAVDERYDDLRCLSALWYFCCRCTRDRKAMAKISNLQVDGTQNQAPRYSVQLSSFVPLWFSGTTFTM